MTYGQKVSTNVTREDGCKYAGLCIIYDRPLSKIKDEKDLKIIVYGL